MSSSILCLVNVCLLSVSLVFSGVSLKEGVLDYKVYLCNNIKLVGIELLLDDGGDNYC
jgi:hypothetical protein